MALAGPQCHSRFGTDPLAVGDPCAEVDVGERSEHFERCRWESVPWCAAWCEDDGFAGGFGVEVERVGWFGVFLLVDGDFDGGPVGVDADVGVDGSFEAGVAAEAAAVEGCVVYEDDGAAGRGAGEVGGGDEFAHVAAGVFVSSWHGPGDGVDDDQAAAEVAGDLGEAFGPFVVEEVDGLGVPVERELVEVDPVVGFPGLFASAEPAYAFGHDVEDGSLGDGTAVPPRAGGDRARPVEGEERLVAAGSAEDGGEPAGGDVPLDQPSGVFELVDVDRPEKPGPDGFGPQFGADGRLFVARLGPVSLWVEASERLLLELLGRRHV